MFTHCPGCLNKENNTPFVVREMIFGTREEFRYERCSKCGSCYLIDNINNFSKFYPSGYHTDFREEPFLKRWLWKQIYYVNFFKKWLIWKVLREIFYKLKKYYPEPNIWWVWEAYRMLENKNKDISIVDLGCGFGTLLHQIRVLWFNNLLGVEPHFINHSTDVHIENITIERFLVKHEQEKRFDIVILSHTFEHFLNQEEILHWLEKVLKDDGVIVLAMPVIGGAFEKFWKNWLSFDAPRHVSIFTDKWFQIMVNRTNLVIENAIYEQTAWELARSELYSWDISFNQIKDLKIPDIDIKKYQILADALNKAKSWWSSVTYFLRKKKK